MKKIKLKESDLRRIIKRVINEQSCGGIQYVNWGSYSSNYTCPPYDPVTPNACNGTEMIVNTQRCVGVGQAVPNGTVRKMCIQGATPQVGMTHRFYSGDHNYIVTQTWPVGSGPSPMGVGVANFNGTAGGYLWAHNVPSENCPGGQFTNQQNTNTQSAVCNTTAWSNSQNWTLQFTATVDNLIQGGNPNQPCTFLNKKIAQFTTSVSGGGAGGAQNIWQCKLDLANQLHSQNNC